METIAAANLLLKIAQPSKLGLRLRGDVEIIVLKALRVEPQERYGTIE
jgi:hypothetical protein